MQKIDNIISIIMVFVTAIGISRAVSLSPAVTVLVVVAAFLLYELILNAANNNPSIRTMLFVTNGFVFGLSLAVIIDFHKGWLSALICLLCMGYKYMVAEASAAVRSRSRNFFVISVNAFFYAAMFTVVECMAFQENGVVFIMIYVVSFAFFMCCYIAYRSMGPGKRRYAVDGNGGIDVDRDIESDWKHIIKRTVNYGRLLRDEFDDALDKSGDTFSGLLRELRKKIVPEYADEEEETDSVRDELDKYRHIITDLANREELAESELEILDRIILKLDSIYHDYYRDGSSRLEYETRITELAGDIELLKNAINVRKERETEDRMKEATQNRRSQAQQARRKREREEREKKEQEERQKREAEEEQYRREEERRRAEEEARRREEEKQRQEKRRRERNQRTHTGTGSSRASGRTAGMDLKYFKGCSSLDEVSLRYKKLCLIYHPDSGNGDVDTYIELKDEYEMLKKRLS